MALMKPSRRGSTRAASVAAPTLATGAGALRVGRARPAAWGGFACGADLSWPGSGSGTGIAITCGSGAACWAAGGPACGIACHLAWVLADAGHRVLFLDLDRQCNATDALADFESLGTCKPLFERSEEQTSELQSLMRISYAVFCLNKNKKRN